MISLEDEDTGDILLTDVHCKLFNNETCRCRDYVNRKQHVPDCVKLTPGSIAKLQWMPQTCAYRLLNEGKDLPEWHHLVSGDGNSIHRAGMSVQGATISEKDVSDAGLLTRITVWPGEPDHDGG